MQVSKGACEETAKDIIYYFEDLLCNNDTKLNNLDPKENKFKDENSYINEKDYEGLVQKITKQLKDFADFVETEIEDAA